MICLISTKFPTKLATKFITPRAASLCIDMTPLPDLKNADQRPAGGRRDRERDVVDRCVLTHDRVGLKPQNQGLANVCRGNVIRGELSKCSRQGILGW